MTCWEVCLQKMCAPIKIFAYMQHAFIVIFWIGFSCCAVISMGRYVALYSLKATSFISQYTPTVSRAGRVYVMSVAFQFCFLLFICMVPTTVEAFSGVCSCLYTNLVSSHALMQIICVNVFYPLMFYLYLITFLSQ